MADDWISEFFLTWEKTNFYLSQISVSETNKIDEVTVGKADTSTEVKKDGFVNQTPQLGLSPSRRMKQQALARNARR